MGVATRSTVQGGSASNGVVWEGDSWDDPMEAETCEEEIYIR